MAASAVIGPPAGYSGGYAGIPSNFYPDQNVDLIDTNVKVG